MKRGLLMSLGAMALVAYASTAQAQTVDLSLNLRYTHPANPALGGNWYLVAKTDDPEGIAGISAYITGINQAGMVYGNNNVTGNGYPVAVDATTLRAILNGGQPFNGNFGGTINVVYGQDTAVGPIAVDVGQGTGTPGNIPVDPLRSAAWNNAALIASGTFGATRPDFVALGLNNTDANTLPGTTVPANMSQDAATTNRVRGDSKTTLGLESPAGSGLFGGDTDRNGTVSLGLDIIPVLSNFQPGATGGWAQGDFDGNGSLSLGLDIIPILSNNGMTSPVATGTAEGPFAAAVPEPGSMLLALLAVCGGVAARKKFTA